MNQIPKEKIMTMINEKWYVQGFNGSFFAVSCGMSGFDLGESLGEAFNKILYEAKREYAKMFYPVDDLNRLSALILKKIKEDKNFLPELQKKYQQKFDKDLSFFQNLKDEDITSSSNKEFMGYMKKVVWLLRDSVGQAHIVEPFALTTDLILKDMLQKHLKDGKKLIEVMSVLTTPVVKSFLNEREEDLFRISKITDDEKRKAEINLHINKFYWVKNNYAGKVILTLEDVEEELSSFDKYVPVDMEKIRKKQQEMVKEFNITGDLLRLVEATRFITTLQDVRKKNILIALDYAGRFYDELSRRLAIEEVLVKYLSFYDITEEGMKLFEDKNIREKLEQRRKGIICLTTPEADGIIIGENYKQFHASMSSTQKKQMESKSINGMTASTGYAMGRVSICLSLEDIKNFKQGNVLVTSMTRPEYLPAMKKAIAIITDEGGITCHAAIVSRELGIPCIIGTKIATKVLKNDMLVEVKAGHGVIIIRND